MSDRPILHLKLPKQRGKYAFNDFAAPPLPRSAAVATDSEWRLATNAHWPRMLAELNASAALNPAIRDLAAQIFGFALQQEPELSSRLDNLEKPLDGSPQISLHPEDDD